MKILTDNLNYVFFRLMKWIKNVSGRFIKHVVSKYNFLTKIIKYEKLTVRINPLTYSRDLKNFIISAG